MNIDRTQAVSLLAAGRRDELAFKLLQESGQAPLEIMGFHAQQSCEKFIKAVLVSHGIVFGRTHDLVALFALCVAHEIQIPIDKNTLRILNQFAVRFRYETCFVEMIDLSDTAIIVEKLKSWAEQKIKQ